MKSIFFLIIPAIIISLFFNACKCGSCQKQDEAEVPYSVLEKANNYIIGKTGKEYFDKHITPDFSQIKALKPGYYMVYRFIVPEKEIDALLNFSVDSLGNVQKDREISGIPECIQHPENCEFLITKKNAVKIAEDNGLAKGIKDWKVGLIWSAKYNKYIWHILSTEEEFKIEDTYRGKGQEIIIDPNNGGVLEINQWKVL